jgi:uncharacterized protein YaaQ
MVLRSQIGTDNWARWEVVVSKLLVAVVHELDADQVISALEEAGHRVTRIPSIGGYLRMDNSTLLMGVEDEAVSDVLALLERECSSREIELPLVLAGRLKDQLPHMIRHGGATVFVADLEGIVRI